MPIAKEHIDPEADKIVRRLHRYGHTAYLVGGCVRDLLLGRTPKDFDVATSATPNEIKDLFRNCRIIGRRFRLAHIFFGNKIIETSTFRANPREGASPDDDELLIRRDNVFGTAEEDARRRDFTMNGLFYDIESADVIDYVGGLDDLEARVVRTIGDPDIRFREDPVRILRAIKFAARLGFRIDERTYAAIVAHRGEIAKCAAPRVLEEIYRLLRGGAAVRSMELLLETGVAASLVPELAWLLAGDRAAPPGFDGPPPRPPAVAVAAAASLEADRDRAWRLLEELDAYTRSGAAGSSRAGVASSQPTNALLFALLAAPFAGGDREELDLRAHAALVEELLRTLGDRLQVSRKDFEWARQILLAQRRLVPSRRRRAKPMALVQREYFGEALVLYELVARSRGMVGDEVSRWRSLWRKTHGEPSTEEGTTPGEASGTTDGAAPAAPSTASTGTAPPASATATEPSAEADDEASRRRRRRRGGRRRRKEPLAGASAEPADEDVGDEAAPRARRGGDGGRREAGTASYASAGGAGDPEDG